MSNKIVIVSGYFNPIHIGHIELFRLAKSVGDKLIVIVNNDFQRELKGSKFFQNENERIVITSSIKWVDEAVLSIDRDRSVQNTLELIRKMYPEESGYELFFANGGDRSKGNIPEAAICTENNIKLIDGLGDKIQSSSFLLKMNT